MLLGLSGQHSFRLVSVTFTFTVFLVSVLDVDFLIHQELVVHRFYCFIRGLERVIRDKPEAFGYSLVVPGDLTKYTVSNLKSRDFSLGSITYLWSSNQISKRTESIVKCFLVNHGI